MPVQTPRAPSAVDTPVCERGWSSAAEICAAADACAGDHGVTLGAPFHDATMGSSLTHSHAYSHLPSVPPTGCKLL
jgi:hypothetical protein